MNHAAFDEQVYFATMM